MPTSRLTTSPIPRLPYGHVRRFLVSATVLLTDLHFVLRQSRGSCRKLIIHSSVPFLPRIEKIAQSCIFLPKLPSSGIARGFNELGRVLFTLCDHCHRSRTWEKLVRLRRWYSAWCRHTGDWSSERLQERGFVSQTRMFLLQILNFLQQLYNHRRKKYSCLAFAPALRF